jgi:3',5'-cyclic AMP phosphodiesterase CpdA
MSVPTADGLPAERPSHLLVHLSDTHLTSRGVAYNRVVDTDAALDRVISRVRTALTDGCAIDAVVASGDLTDTGDPDAYRRVRTALESLALPVVYVMGNHDVRVAFHEHLLDLPDVHAPVLQVHTLRGLRIVALDSTIVGSGTGRLTQEHLDELGDELSTPAEHGTIVVLHHAPIPPPSPLLTYFAMERASRTALADALSGTDVRMVLAGHHHLAQSGMVGSVPVAVSGSTAIRTDPLAPQGRERTTRSASFNLVAVYPDTITVSVVPVDDAGQVFDLSPEECDEVVAAHRQPLAALS